MKHTPRLFYCIRCHVQVVICTHCDRGHIYCGSDCSKAARLQSCREAEKRYQLSPGGRMKHALRQRRYRARLRDKVTDHGYIAPAQDGLLHQVKNKAKKSVVMHVDFNKQCCFCKKAVPPWFRQGFLRHHAKLSARDLPYWRPP